MSYEHPYEIKMKPATGDQHTLTLTAPSSSGGTIQQTIILTPSELRALFAAVYVRAKTTVPGSPEWRAEHPC